MFDIGLVKLAVLAGLALLIFGERLPEAARQAGRALREIRAMADAARGGLRESLGPGFEDFDPRDLHPQTFLRKHLLEAPEPEPGRGPAPGAAAATAATAAGLPRGERPPYDEEAT